MFTRDISFILGFIFAISIQQAVANVREQNPDTVMQRVFSYAERTDLHIGHFESVVYTKFHINNHIRNFTIKLLPHAIAAEKGIHHYFGESVTKYSYADFGIINKKEVAFFSTMKKLRSIPDILQGKVNAMIYEPTIYQGNLLSPFNKKNRRHYKYAIDTTKYVGTQKISLVTFTPKSNNEQYVIGKAWVNYETGHIDSVKFTAVYDRILHIEVNLRQGEKGSLSLLPAQTFIKLRYKFGGNLVNVILDSQMRYEKIDNLHYADSLAYYAGKYQQDITSLNLFTYDTASVVRVKSFFDTIRIFPLTAEEDSFYNKYFSSSKRESKQLISRRTNTFNTSALEDILLDRHNVKFNGMTTLALPPVFTPSMFQWSGSRGFSLQSRLRFNANFTNGRAFKFTPRVGYSFKQKQLYWSLPINFLALPKIGAGIELKIRNGNHIYSSVQAKEVRKQLKKFSNYDSMLNVFNKYNFNYYDDFSSDLALYVEPLVGLKIRSGMTFHRRHLLNWNSVASTNNMNHYYKSIAPYADIEYTPTLYYRRIGNRRIPLYSRWPTFRLSYEKGVRWWTCNSRYERWEFDASYNINLQPMSSLFIRYGGGFFTDRKKDVYFVDYENFSFQNMPIGWEDDMLGEFQLLDRHWYNESNYYVLLCTAYETPSILLSRIPFVSQSIKYERLYMNAVFLQALKAYMECGYGISTNFFDGALFLGLGHASGAEVGAKISLRFFENW